MRSDTDFQTVSYAHLILDSENQVKTRMEWFLEPLSCLPWVLWTQNLLRIFKYSKLMILGFWISKKVHFRPEISSIEQNWWKTCDGYQLCQAVACLQEVPLTWVPVPWQEHFILIVLGFWIFEKLHSRPEKWVFEHRWAFFTNFGENPHTVALFERP